MRLSSEILSVMGDFNNGFTFGMVSSAHIAHEDVSAELMAVLDVTLYLEQCGDAFVGGCCNRKGSSVDNAGNCVSVKVTSLPSST